MEYIELPLLAGLKDKSAYVRRIAVLGCLKACKLDSSFIKGTCMVANSVNTNLCSPSSTIF